MYNNIFDSHAHYESDAFDGTRDDLLAGLPSLGVIRVINAGADILSSEKSIALAEKYDYIYAAVGIHPHSASGWSGGSAGSGRGI